MSHSGYMTSEMKWTTRLDWERFNEGSLFVGEVRREVEGVYRWRNVEYIVF